MNKCIIGTVSILFMKAQVLEALSKMRKVLNDSPDNAHVVLLSVILHSMCPTPTVLQVARHQTVLMTLRYKYKCKNIMKGQ